MEETGLNNNWVDKTWNCKCGSLNAGWLTKCGRCNKQRYEED
jgi:hypothetical protein